MEQAAVLIDDLPPVIRDPDLQAAACRPVQCCFQGPVAHADMEQVDCTIRAGAAGQIPAGAGFQHQAAAVAGRAGQGDGGAVVPATATMQNDLPVPVLLSVKYHAAFVTFQQQAVASVLFLRPA